MTFTEHQVEHFIGTLVSLGGSAGNQRLLEALSWQDSIYQRVKQQLIDDGRILSGRGAAALLRWPRAFHPCANLAPNHQKPSSGIPKRPVRKKSMTSHGAMI